MVACMNDNDFDGRVAVVAGGSKGTGLATARRLRDAGARVVTLARTHAQTHDFPFVQADLSTPGGVAEAAGGVAELVGAPDILVHVVGGSHAPAGGYAVLDDDLWAEELALNLLSAVRLDRALVPAMVARGSGAGVQDARLLPVTRAVILPRVR
ncbi:SDR family NAD(P)-dependent oxidoreductase [Streptomyces hirsutus]